MISPEVINRIIKLVEKNSERVVLVDQASGRGVVVMDLDAYERLAVGPDAEFSPPAAAARTAPAQVSAKPVMVPSITAPAQDVEHSRPAQPAVAEISAEAGELSQGQNEPISVVSDSQPKAQPAPAPINKERAPFGKAKPPVHLPVKDTPPIHRPDQPKKKFSDDPLATPAFADLTQSQLLDKINRDIASWKTAQESKRTEELRSAVKVAAPANAPADNLEDEEHFYLEPVE